MNHVCKLHRGAPTTRRLLMRPSRLGTGVLIALGIVPPFAMAAPNPSPEPAPQEVEFSSAFLGEGSGRYDLSRFERGNPMVAGEYSLDLYVNEYQVSREQIAFREAADGRVRACFSRNLLAVMNVDTGKLEASGANLDGDCLDLEALIPNATVVANADDLRLDVSIPQVALLRNARGYVDPKLWDRGVNAFTLGYTFNASQFDSQQVDHQRQAYLGLEAGLNVGGWRIRNQSNVRWDEHGGTGFDNINTYAQHDVDRLQSQLTIGDTFTEGRLFDSTAFRGVNMATDDRMRPDSMNGYAPIVRGVAETNARVTVRQAGYVVYETTVAPGAFEITDLGASGYGGDLEVIIQEADGRQRSFTVPFAAVPNLLRPGTWRYSATAGQIRNDFLRGDAPNFVEGTYQRGLNNLLTGYVGAQAAGSGLYSSALVGAAFNTPVGAVSLDVTGARTKFVGDDAGHNGYSARITYSKSIPSTNTDFALAAYRYSSLGFFDLQNAVQLNDRVVDGRLAGGVGDDAGGQRSRFQLTLSQRLGPRAGQLYLSGSRGDYWDGRPVEMSYNAGWSNHFRNLSYSVTANRARLGNGQYDDTFYVNVTVPLGHASARSTPPTLNLQGSQGAQGNGLMASVNGSAGERNQVGWGVNGNFGDANNDSVGVNTNWRTPYANLGAAYTRGTDSRQASVSASGGVVIHPGGITLANRLGDTIGIVEAKGAKGVHLSNDGISRVDGRGYAVASSLSPYRLNEVMLDPKGISASVELDNARLLTAPRAGAVVPLKYKTAVGQAYLIHINPTDGVRLPFGAEVDDAAGNVVGYVGQNAQAFVRLPDANSVALSIHWGTQDEQCALNWNPTAEPAAGGVTRSEATCHAR